MDYLIDTKNRYFAGVSNPSNIYKYCRIDIIMLFNISEQFMDEIIAKLSKYIERK